MTDTDYDPARQLRSLNLRFRIVAGGTHMNRFIAAVLLGLLLTPGCIVRDRGRYHDGRYREGDGRGWEEGRHGHDHDHDRDRDDDDRRWRDR
jgi:hypothetical protein